MTKLVRFTKMHGAGNDYIYVDAQKYDVPDPSAAATAKWTNRKIVAAGINYFPLPQVCVKAEYNQRIFHSKYNNEPAVNIGIAYQGFFL